MLKHKRGISAVVATILIIMVSIIAVVILWATLRPEIESGAEEVGKAQECFYLSLSIKNLTLDSPDSGDLTVTVHRDSGKANLEKVRVLVDGSAYDKAEVPQELETEDYVISGSDVTGGSEVEIAGILKGDVICPVSDTATVA
jgi:hypothetical protein